MFYLKAGCGVSVLLASLMLTTTAAGAAVLGPHAAACENGDRPAMLVRVEGLKSRAGVIHVQTYGGNPDHYFDKGAYLERVDVTPPASGPIEVCMPVPQTGLYAIVVKHDLGGDTFGIHNGGGFSGNPNFTVLDVVLRRKPAPARVQVAVRGLTRVPVTLRYLEKNL
jgi:uncharacterized protein (DUF2141 family)